VRLYCNENFLKQKIKNKIEMEALANIKQMLAENRIFVPDCYDTGKEQCNKCSGRGINRLPDLSFF
jgi:hypothetical protein